MNSGKPVCNFCCNTIADREVKDISEPKHQCKNPYAFRLNESLLTKYSYSHSEIMNEKKKANNNEGSSAEISIFKDISYCNLT